MVREFLGNIKGQKGEPGEKGAKGDKGDKGDGLENHVMGSENLFSMSREKWRYSGNIVDYDYRNGVIRFSNTVYQFRYEIYLKKGVYTISVDEVINPEREGYENTVTATLYDSNENSVRTIGILGGSESEHPNIRRFEITESEEIENDGVFNVQIAIANSGRHDGEIHGLQIVRGEILPTWALSTEDYIENSMTSLSGSVDMDIDVFSFDSIGVVDSHIINSYLPNINTENVDSNGVFTLSEGAWAIDMSLRLGMYADNEGYFAVALYQNENIVKRTMKSAKTYDSLRLSATLFCNEGDTVRFNIYGYSMTGAQTSFSVLASSGANYLTMKKIGGL